MLQSPTPHLLADVSNLADQCVPRRLHYEFRTSIHQLIERFEERWTPAVELCLTLAFLRLGLADAAVDQLADERTTVLSGDAELCYLLRERGVDAKNFNHVRDL